MRGDFSVFRKKLLNWFDEQKRGLPWREDPTLYKTVVSEFMLQQTQVDTVLPYFDRWMRAFPDFPALAAAPEAAVVKLWEGLGYYSRARNLHKLALSIVTEGIPASPAEWRRRPGVGPYTAAAISSIAQGIPEPVIDGNVIRVICRLNNDRTAVRSSAEAQKRLHPFAARLVDPGRPGAFNEAVMELGATVCRKARPACLICPVSRHCEARAHGTAESLPVVVRKASTKRHIYRLWLRRGNNVLLQRHPRDARRLAGIAELPLLAAKPDGGPLIIRKRGISSEQITEEIHALPEEHPAVQKCLSLAASQWVALDQIEILSLSGPHRRWIHELIAAGH